MRADHIDGKINTRKRPQLIANSIRTVAPQITAGRNNI